MTRLHQQTANCSDVDVLIGQQDSPSFRVLLPEWIRGKGVKHTGLLHVIPGTWRKDAQGLSGHFTVADQLEIAVVVETEQTAVSVTLAVKNVEQSTISNVWANVCTGVNHLPGNPGWSNERFMPSAPLDRAVQGRYWFEVATPRRLFAFVGGKWIPMHPCPDLPDPAAVPLYSFTPSADAEACACAVENVEGGLWFYQYWNTPCRWCTPCPGNACMHMVPFLTERLSPGATVGIRGRVGMHEGTRSSLEEYFALLARNNNLSNKPGACDGAKRAARDP
ncbi:MAG: hypothetical protein HQ592_11315 [Planctomycetes bacterium]|nr:hypothetical protein [Planctomycetota bacterium]